LLLITFFNERKNCGKLIIIIEKKIQKIESLLSENNFNFLILLFLLNIPQNLVKISQVKITKDHQKYSQFERFKSTRKNKLLSAKHQKTKK
jgi:hypothetical protein